MKKIILFALSIIMGIFQYSNANTMPTESLEGTHLLSLDAHHHHSCSDKKKNRHSPSSNFASIRLFRETTQTLPAGSTLFVRAPLQEAIFTGGSVEFINDAGFIHVNEPGIYKITYGVSALPGQRVRIFVDNIPLRGSTLSCAKSAQMTSQSVITFASEKIALVAIDPITLVQQADRDVTAFLEVVQLKKTSSGSILSEED